MAHDSVVRFPAPGMVEDPLTELLRAGARQLLQQAVEAELAQLLAHHAEERDAQGRAAVVRNGYLPEREVLATPSACSDIALVRRSVNSGAMKESAAFHGKGGGMECSTKMQKPRLASSTMPSKSRTA